MQSPPRGRHRRQHVVGDVARMVDQAVRRGVREDHRRRRDVQRVAHGLGAHVGQVDHHPEPVHLGDHAAADVVEPAQHPLVGGRVGPGDVVVVGQGQVPHAQPVVHPQHRERPVDLVATLRAQQRGHPTRAPTPPRPRRPSSPTPSGRRTARSSGTPRPPARGSRRPPRVPSSTARRPTRTAPRPHPRAAAGGRCGPGRPVARRCRRRRSRSCAGDEAPTAGRCARR